MQGNGDDWKRALVCGICWVNQGVAISTRQLGLLLSKCKSSINAMFHSIGFVAVPTTADYAGALATFFPLIKDRFPELRRWTIRFNRGSGPAARYNGIADFGEPPRFAPIDALPERGE